MHRPLSAPRPLRSAASVAVLLAVAAACSPDPTHAAEPAGPPGEADTLADRTGEPTREAETMEVPQEGAPGAPETATLGERAPGFELPDTEGEVHRLEDYAGRIVVLEWFNPDCPFVVHAHRRGPLAELPIAMQQRGIIWLAVNSAGPGLQGHGTEKNRSIARDWGLEHPILLDEGGVVGRRYVARTTPEVCVIDPNGTLVYRGGLDNAPRGQVKGEGHEVWVGQVLDALLDGTPLPQRERDPYGCGVRYADRKEPR